MHIKRNLSQIDSYLSIPSQSISHLFRSSITKKQNNAEVKQATPLNLEAQNNRSDVFVAARLRECRIVALACEMRLRQVNYKLFIKGLLTVIASLAGVSLFADKRYKAYFDVATVLIAIGLGMHTAGGYDKYQAELREKRKSYHYLVRRLRLFSMAYTWWTGSRKWRSWSSIFRMKLRWAPLFSGTPEFGTRLQPRLTK
eukprot:scaffold1521_cov92-Skeletonema_dohrnii-CCMP3373.AAC.4